MFRLCTVLARTNSSDKNDASLAQLIQQLSDENEEVPLTDRIWMLEQLIGTYDRKQDRRRKELVSQALDKIK